MKIQYEIGKEKYDILINNKIENSISKKINSIKSDKKVLLVYDKKIDQTLVNKVIKNLKETGCSIITLEFQGSKKNKNEKSLFSLLNIMIDNKFTKKSIVISFGGGVLGDLTALAASLYHRGTLYYNIPSTMTSIIDSCIGGKTAINYKNIINSIGNYYHPNTVFIYNEIIKLIPEREFIAGIPEILKCGLIKKNNILKTLKEKKFQIIKRDFKVISELCKETLKTKIFFFKNDVFEKKNRLVLNFGHTFAHAIEMATENLVKKESFRHGEAVGMGILCELYYANSGEGSVFKKTKNLLLDYGLPVKINIKDLLKKKQLLIDNIFKNVFLDKKKISRYPRYISMKKIYRPNVKDLKDENLILQTIDRITE
jgi:3-dehydroquinate synthetase